MSALAKLRRAVLGISSAETEFRTRGFREGGAAQQRLEAIGACFVRGYNTALDEPQLGRLARALEAVPAESRGFACEGAAMALALLDRLLPGRRSRGSRIDQSLLAWRDFGRAWIAADRVHAQAQRRDGAGTMAGGAAGGAGVVDRAF